MQGKYNHNIFFIPTKPLPNPVKQDYLRQQAAYMVQNIVNRLRAKNKAVKNPCATSGRVWNKELNTMCSYSDFINYETPEIFAQKTILEDVFRVFRLTILKIGFENWKFQTVRNLPTYPQYTVAIISEKRRTRLNKDHLWWGCIRLLWGYRHTQPA